MVTPSALATCINCALRSCGLRIPLGQTLCYARHKINTRFLTIRRFGLFLFLVLVLVLVLVAVGGGVYVLESLCETFETLHHTPQKKRNASPRNITKSNSTHV